MAEEKKTILIIDDEEDFTFFVKLNLESSGGFVVHTSANGQEGIEMAKAIKPDMILLDILMPAMHGTDVAERLLSASSTKNIPVVYLTAVVRKEDLEANDGIIGGRKFIAKPISPEELIAEINTTLA